MNSLKVVLLVPMGRPPLGELDRAQSYPWVNDNGLASVAAAAIRAGAEVTLWGWNHNFTLEQLKAKLREIDPAIVGIKTFTTHFHWIRQTLEAVRVAVPTAKVVLGGPHASTSSAPDLFDDFPDLFDYAVAGDGEAAISGLIELIRSGHQMNSCPMVASIPGLVYRDATGIQINRNRFDADFSALPSLDWSLQPPSEFPALKNRLGGHSVYYEDSRGCPGRCAHCQAGIINGIIPRRKSMEQMKDELEPLFVDHGVNYVVFTGNGFLSDQSRVEALCQWFLSRRSPVRWSCTGAVYLNRLLRRELLALMKRAGCDKLIFGVESGADQVRHRLNYPTEISDIEQAVRTACQCDVETDGYFMFGLPHETPAEMRASLRCAAALPFNAVRFCICLPLPGTRSYTEVLKKYGLARIDWATYDFSHPSLLPAAATAAEIRAYLLVARILERSRAARTALHLLS